MRRNSTRFGADEGVEEVTGRLGQSVGLRVHRVRVSMGSDNGSPQTIRPASLDHGGTTACQYVVCPPAPRLPGPSTAAPSRSVNGLLVLSGLPLHSRPKELYEFIVGLIILTVPCVGRLIDGGERVRKNVLRAILNRISVSRSSVEHF